MDALAGRTWDAVLDTCGYVPRIVRQSAEALAGSVGRYVFISTISVYADFRTLGQDESAPVATLKDPAVEEVTGETYGPLKVLCEQAVETALPGRALIVRPGFIVGPHDSTDRFTYWPHRIASGGDVLAAGSPAQRVQIIDARDLAAWTLRMVEQGRAGTFNAIGPDDALTLGEILETCRAVSGSDARFVWAGDQFLQDNDAASFLLFPFYLPADTEMPAMMSFRIAKAVEAGLTFRPLAETVRDTLAWNAARPAGTTLDAGLTRERERELLTKLREKNPENFPAA